MDILDKPDDISARLREIPDDIEITWPESIRLSLAAGRAVRVQITPTNRGASRSVDALSRLNREPAVQAEVQRILEIIGLEGPDPFPSGGTREEILAWGERHESRDEIVRREAKKFAGKHRFSYIAPGGVVAVFIRIFSVLRLSENGRLPEEVTIRAPVDVPAMYVNPLADSELAAPVPPGHILVDVTHATTSDLEALAAVLTQIQKRLGYRKHPGGRPAGRTHWSKDEFLEGLPRAMQSLEERNLRKPTDTELAAEMGIPDPTFYRYKRRFLSDSE